MIKRICKESKKCVWNESINDDGEQCGWCQHEEVQSEETEKCDSCLLFEEKGSCERNKQCKWCPHNYCTPKEADCKVMCENMNSEDSCNTKNKGDESPCFWCKATSSCYDIGSPCYDCVYFSTEMCPKGCGTCGAKSSNPVLVSLVVVFSVLFIVLICFGLLFYRLKMKRAKYTSMSQPSIPLNFYDDFAGVEDAEEVKKTERENIKELVQSSKDVLTFGHENESLKLFTEYADEFKVKNLTSKEERIILFTNGFKERHDIKIEPSECM